MGVSVLLDELGEAFDSSATTPQQDDLQTDVGPCLETDVRSSSSVDLDATQHLDYSIANWSEDTLDEQRVNDAPWARTTVVGTGDPCTDEEADARILQALALLLDLASVSAKPITSDDVVDMLAHVETCRDHLQVTMQVTMHREEYQGTEVTSKHDDKHISRFETRFEVQMDEARRMTSLYGQEDVEICSTAVADADPEFPLAAGDADESVLILTDGFDDHKVELLVEGFGILRTT